MDEPILQPDPAKLKAARQAAGLRPVDMAAILNVTDAQICMIEASKSEPKGSQLAQWAEACKVKMEDLCTRAPRYAFFFRKKLKPRLKSIDKLNVV